jgi:hypothetical protein
MTPLLTPDTVAAILGGRQPADVDVRGVDEAVCCGLD